VLRRLRCEEFVIVAEAEIAFGPGLNVITGETGTGKSVLIDAIGFLAGGRAEVGWIREGASGLAVEGTFEIDRLPAASAIAAELGAEAEGGTLRLRREIGENGRAKAWAGGRAVRVGDLRRLGEQLIAIHGQGEHRRLLDPAVQLMLLDRFAGAIPLREQYAARRDRWRDLAADGAASIARLSDLSEKEEWHRFQHDEIAEAQLVPGEEEILREKRDAAAGRRRVSEARGEIERILFEEEGSAAERIETALHRLGPSMEGEWGELRSEIESAREALRRARRILPFPPGDAADDEDLDGIEERLSRIAKLKKKYGGSIEAVLDRRAALASLLDETERLRARCAAFDRELAEAAAATAASGLALRKRRGEIAPSLSRAVTRELRDLGMAGASFDVVIEEEACLADDPDSLRVDDGTVRARTDGIDRGWFRLRPNPGEGAGPIGEIASGGELSRALLGIVAVLGASDEPRTAIFDEVDAGVGGATATAVARRLTRIAQDRQVLLVTHLPLVACRAARHFRVEKGERGGRTIAGIATLDREGRIGELARMLAGEGDSAIARRHAVALMESAAGDAV
jgi:DNA repair protein RecN (Recombination protein N)